MSDVEEGGDDFIALTRESVRSKILHVLEIYPMLSSSMLQVGIGTGMPPTFWRPIYVELLREGLIVEETIQSQAPNGRMLSHKIIRLATTSKDAFRNAN